MDNSFLSACNSAEKQLKGGPVCQNRQLDVAVRTHLLKENVPAELPEKYLPVSNDKASTFEPFDLMDTKEELEVELAGIRENYKPFLENHAPSIKQTRARRTSFKNNDGERQ